jgi:hypothetical protein
VIDEKGSWKKEALAVEWHVAIMKYGDVIFLKA